ncbi:MAG: transposase, partial [Armatimonadota bacterium]|nr:transposase [Armatimonadota bacterium]
MTADFRMALLELLRQYQGQPEGNTLREGLRWLAQQLMEAEVGELIGAARYERAPCRATYRNGYRP